MTCLALTYSTSPEKRAYHERPTCTRSNGMGSNTEPHIGSVSNPTLHDRTQQVRLRTKKTAFRPQMHDDERRDLAVAVEHASMTCAAVTNRPSALT